MGSMKQLAGNVLFQEKLVIKVNKPSDPIFYVCDYQYRHLTMEFQHFHEYYEMYLLLDDDAAHVIEGEFFELCGWRQQKHRINGSHGLFFMILFFVHIVG